MFYVAHDTQILNEVVDHDHLTSTDGSHTSVEQLLAFGRSQQNEGQNEEAITRLKDAVSMADNTNCGDIKAKAPDQLGTASDEISTYEIVIGYSRKSREISPDPDMEELKIKQWLGFNHLQAGEYKESIKYYKEAVKLASELGCKSRHVNADIGLGSAYSYIGDIESSKERFFNALAVAEELSDNRLKKEAYTNLATAYYKSSKFDAAVESYLKAQDLSREVDEKAEQANVNLMLGHSFRHLKQYNSAIEYYQDALKIIEELHSKDMQANGKEKALEVANINEWCGYCCTFIDGRHEDARLFYENALKMAKEVGDKYQEYRASQVIASIFYNRRNYTEAKNTKKKLEKLLLNFKINILKEYLIYT